MPRVVPLQSRPIQKADGHDAVELPQEAGSVHGQQRVKNDGDQSADHNRNAKNGIHQRAEEVDGGSGDDNAAEDRHDVKECCDDQA